MTTGTITGIDDGALSASYGGLGTLASTYRSEASRLLGCLGLGPRAIAELAASVPVSPVTGAEAERTVLWAVAGLGEQAAEWEAAAAAVEATLAAYRAADGGAAELFGYGLGAGMRTAFGPEAAATTFLLSHLHDLPLHPTGAGRPAPRTSQPPASPWSRLEPLLGGPEWALTHEPAITAQGIGVVAGFAAGATGRAPGVTSGAAGLASAYGQETAVHVAALGSTSGPAPTSLAAAMDHLARVSGAYAPMADGTIAITRVHGPTGRAWIVDIPGTDDMDPVHALSGSTLRDMKENLRYVAGEPTAYSRGVLAAMREAGIRTGEPVMLVGHSQGGMTAQTIAQASPYDVRQVLTAGSPDVPGTLPAGVRSLQLEHAGDLVPELDGRGPDASPQHLTVTFASGDHGIVGNHGFADYDAGAAAVDGSSDPRLAAQIAAMRADGFLGAGDAITTVYRLSRAG